MNVIAELHADREGRAHLRTYEGNYDTYRAARKAEQSAAHRRVNEAKNEARKAERERIENQIKLDRNVRRGRDFERSKRKPGLAMGLDKNSSERSAGKLRAAHESMVADARAAVSEAQENLRVQERICIWNLLRMRSRRGGRCWNYSGPRRGLTRLFIRTQNLRVYTPKIQFHVKHNPY